MIIKQCGICKRKDIEGKSYNDLGDYCNHCISRIKCHLKGLKMESS